MTVFSDAPVRDRMIARLHRLYGDDFDAAAFLDDRLEPIVAEFSLALPRTGAGDWSERDAVLITYGDQFRDAKGAEPPLRVLDWFLTQTPFAGLFSDVHLLPCFPYTSDDGFSVSDYDRIDPALGDWDDVDRIAESTRVAFDLVLNHCSASHDWFARCVKDEQPYADYFHRIDPQADVSQVTRPRSHPLLSEFETASGPASFWTTFSDDQIDLNFSSPNLLAEMLRVLMLYLAHGGRIIRLDAIAYLWKTLGTSCIHLPETHEVVRLMRDVVDVVAPDAILLTETNVPHAENVSYFGNGDEAHMVYQFSLAPLLLDALVSEDATYLNRWLSHLAPPPEGCTYFNFTASHDGVGVRPLEGLAPPNRLDAIIDTVRANGGQVSMKRNADGSESPYELNITLFSAVNVPTPEFAVRRFAGTQLLQLSLQGIPGVYVHSIPGSPNWTEGVAETGRARTVNRRKFTRDEVEGWFDGSNPHAAAVSSHLRDMLAIRREHIEFSPDASQTILQPERTDVVQVLRGDSVLAAFNVTDGRPSIDAGITLEPYEAVWMQKTGDGWTTLLTTARPS